ncbi:unnamed protein product, partial [Meganyctiphanes norvegica]
MLNVGSGCSSSMVMDEDEDDFLNVQDDDDDDQVMQDHHHGLHMSKAELRKSNKPIMEKRRRARINCCLGELKGLILDAMNKDPARHSKLEKADILEMTVKHLQAVQRQQLALAVAHEPAVLNKFRGGFTECAQEVTRYVSRIEGVDGGVRQRLINHLGQCVGGLNSMTPLSFTAMAGLPPLPMVHLQSSGGAPPLPPPPPGPQQNPGDVNNNQARLIQGLVAARLAAAGDAAGAALLLHGGLSLLARSTQPPAPMSQDAAPSSGPNVNSGASSSTERSSLRASAFTAVRRPSSPLHTQPPEDRPTQQGVVPPPPQVVAPTARRPLLDSRDSVIRPQVISQSSLVARVQQKQHELESRVPLDFSFRKHTIGRSAPTFNSSNLPAPRMPSPTNVEMVQSNISLKSKRPLDDDDNQVRRPNKLIKLESQKLNTHHLVNPIQMIHITNKKAQPEVSLKQEPQMPVTPKQSIMRNVNPISLLTPVTPTQPLQSINTSQNLYTPVRPTQTIQLTPPGLSPPETPPSVLHQSSTPQSSCSNIDSHLSSSPHTSRTLETLQSASTSYLRPTSSPTSTSSVGDTSHHDANSTPTKDSSSEESSSPESAEEDKDMWRPW